MKTAIVTGADKKFIPGVIAFYNSLKANGNVTTDLVLFAHGDSQDFSKIPEEFRIIYNPDPIKSPASKEWPEEIPAMYSRVMIPRILSEYDRVIWFDADTIILKDLNPLLNINMEEKPVAATSPGADWQQKQFQYMPFQFQDPSRFPEMKDIRSLQAGVLVYDIKKWNELDLDKQVDDILLSNIEFKYVVQGVLGYLLKGEFKLLDYIWNCPVSWLSRYKINDIAVLHFVGGANKNPWQTEMMYNEVWRKYYG